MFRSTSLLQGSSVHPHPSSELQPAASNASDPPYRKLQGSLTEVPESLQDLTPSIVFQQPIRSSSLPALAHPQQAPAIPPAAIALPPARPLDGHHSPTPVQIVDLSDKFRSLEAATRTVECPHCRQCFELTEEWQRVDARPGASASGEPLQMMSGKVDFGVSRSSGNTCEANIAPAALPHSSLRLHEASPVGFWDGNSSSRRGVSDLEALQGGSGLRGMSSAPSNVVTLQPQVLAVLQAEANKAKIKRIIRKSAFSESLSRCALRASVR
jgi:hypothetical protein